MKKVLVTYEKLVFNKEELSVVKSWGSQWGLLLKDFKKYGKTTILEGLWSGYEPGSIYEPSSITRKVVSRMRLPYGYDPTLKTVVYTDNTALDFIVKSYDLEDFISKGLRRISGYDSLITRSMLKGKAVVSVLEVD